MSAGTLDLMGLYNYDETVLDTLVLPESIEDKRETIKTNILLDSAEQEIIYADPTFLKLAIRAWSTKQAPIWDEMYKTTQYDYNPIWNKDGTIQEIRKSKEKVDDDNLRTDALQDMQTRNAKDKQTLDTEDLETRDLKSESLQSVYGYNSDSDAPSDKTEGENTGTDKFNHTGSVTDDHTGTIKDDHTGTQKNERDIKRNTYENYTRTETGNIGVTSTQSLILEQRGVVSFNIVDYIIKEFKDRFCLKVY